MKPLTLKHNISTGRIAALQAYSLVVIIRVVASTVAAVSFELIKLALN